MMGKFADTKPFYAETLKDERPEEKGTIFTVRLNEQEWERLRQAKEWFDTDQNSTTLKILVDVGYNVLHQQFSKDVLEWLFKKDRVRKIDGRTK